MNKQNLFHQLGRSFVAPISPPLDPSFAKLEANFLLKHASIELVGPITDITGKAWFHDSRQVTRDSVFIALAGAQENGHSYVFDAIAAGAQIICIERDWYNLMKNNTALDAITCLICDNTAIALKQLAAAWRAVLSLCLVAITGSAGKTTTKELIGAILKKKYGSVVYVSRGNQNTLIGCSLNILSINIDCRYAIFELGISKQGEMEYLIELVQPDIACITLIAHSHIEGLGNIETIAQEKLAIMRSYKKIIHSKYIETQPSLAVVNGDVALLRDHTYSMPVIQYGIALDNDICFSSEFVREQLRVTMKIGQQTYILHGPIPSKAHAYAMVAAITIGAALGLSVAECQDAVEHAAPVFGRFYQQKVACSDSAVPAIVIHDAYNANPESLMNSLQAIDAFSEEKKLRVMLGDMRELGAQSYALHVKIVQDLLKNNRIQEIVLIGDHFTKAFNDCFIDKASINNNTDCYWFCYSSYQEGLLHMEKYPLRPNDVWLCKGSYGTYTWRIAEHILRRYVWFK